MLLTVSTAALFLIILIYDLLPVFVFLGMSEKELEILAKTDRTNCMKISRRDLPSALSQVGVVYKMATAASALS